MMACHCVVCLQGEHGLTFNTEKEVSDLCSFASIAIYYLIHCEYCADLMLLALSLFECIKYRNG